jgi:hypothetical protein
MESLTIPMETSSNYITALASSMSPLEAAIWRTLAYVDVFDYPLTVGEIHRYLEGVSATFEEVEAALTHSQNLFPYLVRHGEYYMLAGREHTVGIRQSRVATAHLLWPVALHYGEIIARLPFVRMVAVTGSLAMANAEIEADIDYLIVARNDRVWICRAFVILLVRLAGRRDHYLCPNYVLSERALYFPNRNLYAAHELTQMIPLWGMDVYQQMREANAWTSQFLPNAAGPPSGLAASARQPDLLRRLIELPLLTPAGRWLDRWEMKRKIQKFQRQHDHLSEADFSTDWCKGHFDAHRRRTLTAYAARIQGDA